MERVQITKESLDAAFTRLKGRLYARLNEKGHGTFASRHEALGVLQEEWTELNDADCVKDPEHWHHEIEDIAVGCLFTMACDIQGTMEW
jgi:hypothetical protein